MRLQQILTALIAQGQQGIICSPFQQILDDLIIKLLLCLIHLHLQTAEVVQQGETILLIYYPIQICSMLDEQVGDEEADLFILETSRFFYQSEENDCQGNLVEQVGLVDFCLRQQQQSHDFVIAHDAGSDERCLSVILCLEVDVHQFILKQYARDILQACIGLGVPK